MTRGVSFQHTLDGPAAAAAPPLPPQSRGPSQSCSVPLQEHGGASNEHPLARSPPHAHRVDRQQSATGPETHAQTHAPGVAPAD